MNHHFEIVIFMVFELLIQTLGLLLPVLLAVAFFTLFERKLMGSMQRRLGPNIVGYFGFLQPFADALKLIFKEPIIPKTSNFNLFILAPLLAFFLALSSYAVIPLNTYFVIADINVGVMYLLAISSLNVYSVIIAGWASNNRYAFLGALRSAAQMISYEVSLGIIILTVVLCAGSLNLTTIVVAQYKCWYIVPLFPSFVLFFISALAETNRAPFDLVEAEGELVAGYYVEYSGILFVLFFIAEYANMILMSFFSVILFFGGWWLPFASLLNSDYKSSVFIFSFKVLVMIAAFIWVRASLPRFRYDQLMSFGWKVVLPISLGLFVFTAAVLYGIDGLPPLDY